MSVQVMSLYCLVLSGPTLPVVVVVVVVVVNVVLGGGKGLSVRQKREAVTHLMIHQADSCRSMRRSILSVTIVYSLLNNCTAYNERSRFFSLHDNNVSVGQS